MATLEQQKEAQRAKQRRLDAERAESALEEQLVDRLAALDLAEHTGRTVLFSGEEITSSTRIPQFRPFINNGDLKKTLRQALASGYYKSDTCSLIDVVLTDSGIDRSGNEFFDRYLIRLQENADKTISARAWLNKKTSWQVHGCCPASMQVGELMMLVAGAPEGTDAEDFFKGIAVLK